MAEAAAEAATGGQRWSLARWDSSEAAWPDWKFKAMAYFRMAGWLPVLCTATDPLEPTAMAAMGSDAERQAVQTACSKAYSAMAMSLEGEALTRLKAVTGGNGWAAWQVLTQRFDARGKLRTVRLLGQACVRVNCSVV